MEEGRGPSVDLQSAASPLRHRASGPRSGRAKAAGGSVRGAASEGLWRPCQGFAGTLPTIARCGVGGARSRRYALRRRESDAVLLLQYRIASARQPPRGTNLQEPAVTPANPKEATHT